MALLSRNTEHCSVFVVRQGLALIELACNEDLVIDPMARFLPSPNRWRCRLLALDCAFEWHSQAVTPMLLEELPKFIQKILARPGLDCIYDALIFLGLKRVLSDNRLCVIFELLRQALMIRQRALERKETKRLAN